jgi:hypothetical protein
MEMDESQKKEQFSTAFVNAISAQSGLRTAVPTVDDDSIDIIIKGRRFEGIIRNPQIEIQLKCTASDDGDEEFLKFNLPLKNYDDLRANNILCPRYLFVFVVPDNCQQWLIHQNNYSQIKHCCYYFSLLDFPKKDNKTSVTISIPRKQRLTSESMIALMLEASLGDKNVKKT